MTVNGKTLSIILLIGMWLAEVILSQVFVLGVQNVVFGVPIRDIFVSSTDPRHVNCMLYGSIIVQVVSIYITVYIWARIVLRKNWASRDWLVEMLGEDMVRYLRIPKN